MRCGGRGMLQMVVCVPWSAPNLHAQSHHVTSVDLQSSEPRSGWRAAARWAFGLASVFLLLLAWRRDVLRDPPFFECATGLYMEAVFLAETNFDYDRLRHREKYVAEGGPYAYMTSILPTLIAFTMRATSRPSDVFLVFHLFGIGCAALTLVCVFELLMPATGPVLAAYCAAAVMTNPLFSAQIDMLGMDLPMTGFAVLAALLLLRGWQVSGVLAGLMAFLMKPTGALVTVAALLYLGTLLVVAVLARRGTAQDQQPAEAWRLALGLFVAIVTFGVELAIARWGGINEKLLGLVLPGNSFLSVWIVCPDLVALAVLACGVTIVWLATITWRQRRGQLAAAKSTSREAGVVWPTMAFSWVMVVATTAAIVRYGFVPPRYFTLIVPFVMVIWGLLLAAIASAVPRAGLFVLLLVGLNLINWDGKFFPQLDEVTTWSRGGDRSRAYLLDLRTTI